MAYITFSGSCVNCITCVDHQRKIWRSLFCCHLANFYFLFTNYMLISQPITFTPKCHNVYAKVANVVDGNRSVSTDIRVRQIVCPVIPDTPTIVIGPPVLLSRYPISRCDTYRDTWVMMRYVSRYLIIQVSQCFDLQSAL